MSEPRVRPLTRAIGAELSGLDLRAPLDSPQREAIRRALERHLLLVFRDQPLSPGELLAFGRSLGTLQIHPFAPSHPDHRELVVLDQSEPEGAGGDAWHADATFMPEPPRYGVLQAIVLPEIGGDTLFASMPAAFAALSAPLQELLEKLRAVHDLTARLRSAVERGHARADLRSMQEQWPPTAHPVVRVHPATACKSLFVNGNFTTAIEELSRPESDALLAFLFSHLGSPRFHVRVHWEPHSVAVWDNHFVQHFAVPDYSQRRVMHRLNLLG